MTLAQHEQRLTEALARNREPSERLAWLVEEARRRPMMDPHWRIDAHRVEGCLARLWFVAEFRDGRCEFQSESDSLIVKAVAGLLCEFYSGRTPGEILAHPPEFLNRLGISQHLTLTRRNGLARVWETIRSFAAAQAETQRETGCASAARGPGATRGS